ncbi:MAG: GspMb/PilO family protein [Verrucomicrobiota bacterium]|nr:GspMb/PilO family protein [Verrucomicrobiota bacterium]
MNRKNSTKDQKSKMLSGVAIIIILAIFYLIRFSGTGFDMPLDLPSEATISAKLDKLEKLNKKLRNTKETRLKEKAKRKRLTQLTEAFWKTTGQIPASEIQRALEKTARKARVQMRTIGAPKVNETSENIREVELSVSINTQMKDLSRFIKEIDLARPRFFWDNCSIRPDRINDPRGVILSGKIKSYVLTKTATEFLLGKNEETENK